MQPSLIRSGLATIAGILLAFALIYLAQYVGNVIDPVVAMPDAADPAALEIQIPLINTLSLLVGWLIGAFAGGWLAARASGVPATAWIVGGAVFGAGVTRALSLGEAWWMVALAFALPMVAAWLAGRTAQVTV
ncbi:MAG: hypothetical protein HC788_01755 [Sphingopyxis sp.]|nr:hypothetical protein [Sphingopyxis sp.]